MAWRAEHNRVSESLANAKREYEKQALGASQGTGARAHGAPAPRGAGGAEATQGQGGGGAKGEGAPQRESKRMDEDAAVAVRTKALGKDRFLRTYWWGIGGVKGAVYVEDLKGNWGVLTARREVDALVDALHVWGVREKALRAKPPPSDPHDPRRVSQARARRTRSSRARRLRASERAARRLGRRAPADESAPLDATRRFAETLCAAAETAAAHRFPTAPRGPRTGRCGAGSARRCASARPAASLPGRCSRSRRRCTTCR